MVIQTHMYSAVPPATVAVVAYLSSCHGIASDATSWMNSTLFIVIHARRNPHLLRNFQGSNVPVILVHWICCLFELLIVKLLFKDLITLPGCELNPDYSIRVIVKTMPLPSWLRCRPNCYALRNPTLLKTAWKLTAGKLTR